ncbi:MAG TPA: hypothetical protein VMU22_15175 [Rhizomicrobium sp.]|nr:hypothetical protein [Rhizomicrobium sp.]
MSETFNPPFTSDDELAAIAAGVIDRTLPKPQWTHRAHFAAALWLKATRPELELPWVMPRLIRAFNEATGVANTDTSGYHETITQASLRAASSFLANQNGKPLFAVLNTLMDSPLGKSDWLLAYWTKERLFSVEARRRWVEPDIKPLPF